jgi:hypothetical protein
MTIEEQQGCFTRQAPTDRRILAYATTGFGRNDLRRREITKTPRWSNRMALMELKANDHCCQEASIFSGAAYIPCNAPATSIVGWKGRPDDPIRMCDACARHNIRNRGGELIGPYKNSPPA